MTFLRLLESARVLLSCPNSESIAEQLLMAARRQLQLPDVSRLELHLKLREAAEPELVARVLDLATRCASGEPLQYVTGYQYFLEHEYRVTPEVLIPRPETEVLVSAAIRILENTKPLSTGFEIGLGSGIVSVELLAHFKTLRMTASELSSGAEQLAIENANRILSQKEASSRLTIRRVQSGREVWEPFRGCADFLISNPPYLMGPGEAESGVVSTEPHLALFAPVGEVNYFYEKVALGAPRFIRPGGWVFMEIPHERDREIREMFMPISNFVELIPDLTGRSRVLVANLPE